MPAKKKVAPPLDLSAPPPFSMEAEACILGSMLADTAKTCYPTVIETVKEDDFYLAAHKTCFQELVKLYEEGKGIDLITFSEHMRTVNLMDEVGGVGFVTALFSIVPTGANVKSYIEIVKDKALLRQAAELSREVLQIAYNEQSHFDELLTTLAKFLNLEKFSWKARKTIRDLIDEIIERMQSDKPDEDILRTHITLLDKIVKIHKGDFVVIHGKPKSGKSILATTIFANHCIKEQKPGLFISLESPAIEIANRIFSGVSRIPMDDLHVSKLSQDQMTKAMEAATRIGSVPLMIRDDVFDIHSIAACIRESKQHHPDLAMAILDYCQLVKTFREKGQSREEEVASISRSLRRLSMELRLPIIVLAQENVAGDTRESKSLMMDATALLKITDNEDDNTQKHIGIIQRNGSSHEGFMLRFLGYLGRMENLASAKSHEGS